MHAQKSISTRRKDRRDGFTLMEVVVAVIIVGMTAVATLSAFATELRTAASSRSSLEAAALAESRLAMLELTPAEELLTLPDSSRRGKFDAPFEGYEWTGAVSPVRNEADLFDATVRVTWTDGSYMVATRMYRPVPPVTLR